MNKDDLLNSILYILQEIKDDKEKLQKTYDFFTTEIIEELVEEEEIIEIPQRFKPLIKDIAEMIGSGHISYLNLTTLEHIEIPKDMDSFLFYDEENPLQKDIDRAEEWENLLVIEPLESKESFRIMDGFVNTVSDKFLQNKLQNALQNRRPFANFKNLIDNSAFRQQWFDYKQSKLEEYVYFQLESLINQTEDQV